MAIGTHLANNIFAQESNKLSMSRAVDGNMSESDFRDMSRKEAAIDVGIRKDELEYEYVGDMEDQWNELQKEHAKDKNFNPS